MVDRERTASRRFSLRVEADRRAAYEFAARLEGRPLANWMKHHLDQVAERALVEKRQR